MVEDLHAARLEIGGDAALIADLDEATAVEPLREQRWAQLMLALHRDGRQAEALRAFRRARTILGEQLGLEPSEDLRDLERAIIADDPTLSATRRPWSGPRRARRPGRRARPRLPPILTSFVGRGDERRLVAKRLDDGSIVTITGPGGVGKTRLAIELAGDVQDSFADGVWFVDLTPTTETLSLTSAVAEAIGVHETPGTALDVAILDRCTSLRGVIVLDNCEHVIGDVAQPRPPVARRGAQPAGAGDEPRGAGRGRRGRRPPGAAGHTAFERTRHDAHRGHRRRAPLRRPRRRRRPGVRDQREQRGRRGLAVPTPRRPPARHRTGRRPGVRARPGADRRSPGRPVRRAAQPSADRAGSTPQPAGVAGLERGTARSGRAHDLSPTLGVPVDDVVGRHRGRRHRRRRRPVRRPAGAHPPRAQLPRRRRRHRGRSPLPAAGNCASICAGSTDGRRRPWSATRPSPRLVPALGRRGGQRPARRRSGISARRARRGVRQRRGCPRVERRRPGARGALARSSPGPVRLLVRARDQARPGRPLEPRHHRGRRRPWRRPSASAPWLKRT